jgi:3-phosphoshikimate 1-carboxyvinyltransferase
MDASSSSQFVSGLLLAGSRYEQGLTVDHVGPPVPSQPHLTMTVEVLRQAGAQVDDLTPNRWRVEPGPLRGLDVVVEPDLSNAAPFLAAALVTGGEVVIPGWPQRTTQAGDGLRDLLDSMGAEVSLNPEGLTVRGTGEIYGIDADLRPMGELTPVLAALAALADSPSRFTGIGHLRGHETDRLTALRVELGRVGVKVTELPDGLVITPGPLRAARFHSYADHRMATAGAVLGLRIPGLVVEDIGTTAKTLPNFPRLWAELLAGRAVVR